MWGEPPSREPRAHRPAEGLAPPEADRPAAISGELHGGRIASPPPRIRPGPVVIQRVAPKISTGPLPTARRAGAGAWIPWALAAAGTAVVWWWWSRPPASPTQPGDPRIAAPAPLDVGAAEQTPLTPPRAEHARVAGSATTVRAATEPASAPGPRPSALDDPRDPRWVPDDAPPEARDAFVKIPIGLSDGPPVGGVGRSGIHVDDIAVGASYEASLCADRIHRFSLAEHKEVNVCFRVVHGRADEEQLAIAWQREGRTVRRSKLKIPRLHAYRTRVFLNLRSDYVGAWTARIFHEDVELAAIAFEVIP